MRKSEPLSSNISSPSSSSINPSSRSLPNNEEQNFYAILESEKEKLISKYSSHIEDYDKKELSEVLSEIFKDFYELQNKLLSCKENNENNINNDINNINNERNNIIEEDDKEQEKNKDLKLEEHVNMVLIDIFFSEPFDKYTLKFDSFCDKVSKEYLTQNLLEAKKNLTYTDYLEQEIFKTKLPKFSKSLLVMMITDKENKDKEKISLDEEEKKLLNQKIKINERAEKNIKVEDWDLEKILNRLDTQKEKERLKPILKEMEEDLKPKPSYFKGEETCAKEYESNKEKFNIIAMSRYYLNMENITICISGFLTEKQDHYSGWKEFVRFNNQATMYYFLNWPSESSFGSIWYFNNTKKRANYFGKILANMIVSEKFFKNKKITLVGHSLGCHFIKCCIKEIAENKDDDFKIATKIEKIIFLGGATQIKNKKRWVDIIKQVTKGNIYNFYSNKDYALKIMESRLIWGKNSIGRNPLLISGIDVHNFDCSNITFEDMLNHGYKQVYGKIVEYFNL